MTLKNYEAECKRCQKLFRPIYQSKGLYCSHKCSVRRGAEHSMWKGDAVIYQGIHSWFRDKKDTKCAFCGADKKLELALRKGFKHERRIENYYTLCVPCHRKYDAHVAWNKGKYKYAQLPCSFCLQGFRPQKASNRYCSKPCAMKGRWLALNKKI